ncbi:LysR family transcriptional regulator [Amycolatopsis dongchuanensis]
MVTCRTGMAGMDLKQLKALVTVADVGSVTKAAELLHVVQPAVTRQIRALEHEVGVPLFDRTRQGMRPTEAGLKLVERARRALTELERARAELTPDRGAITGIVTVGLLDSTAELLAEPLVSAVRRAHPGIELRVLSAYSGHLQQWLDDGDLDLSLLYNLTGTPSLNVTPVVRERLWAVAGPGEGLRPDVAVPFAEAAARPMVMPAPGHGLHTLITTAAREAGTTIDAVVQTNSMALQKQLVRGGHGWTVLPAVGIAADLAAGTLTAAPLAEPEVWRSIVLGVPRAAPATPAVRVVAAELTAQVHTAVHKEQWPSARLPGD